MRTRIYILYNYKLYKLISMFQYFFNRKIFFQIDSKDLFQYFFNRKIFFQIDSKDLFLIFAIIKKIIQ